MARAEPVRSFALRSSFWPWDIAADESLALLFPLPTSDGRQQVLDLHYEGPGTAACDSRGNQLVSATLPRGSRPTFTARLTLRPHQFGVDRLELPEPIAADLDEEVLVPLTPDIRDLARTLAQGETTAEGRARTFFRYVRDHVTYQYPPEARGAQCALVRRQGDCGEYAVLFTALCRAAGIPARPVYGWIIAPWLSTPHAWAEVWLGAHGWCPVDANLAREYRYWAYLLDVPKDPEFFFGSLDGYRVVLTRGTGLPWPAASAEAAEPVQLEPALALNIDGQAVHYWQELVKGRVPYLQLPYVLIHQPAPALKKRMAKVYTFKHRPERWVPPPNLIALATWCLQPRVFVASFAAGLLAVTVQTVLSAQSSPTGAMATVAWTLRGLTDMVTLLLFLAVAAGFLMGRGRSDYLTRGVTLMLIGGVIVYIMLPRWLNSS